MFRNLFIFCNYIYFAVEATYNSESVKFPIPDAEKEGKPDYWYRNNNDRILNNMKRMYNTNVAKNVVFFLGDGMGISTVTAGRIYKGQQYSHSGEESLLAFDTFPDVSLSKTYCLDRQTSDSATTATAYLCGIKANYGTIGVDGRWQQGDCHNDSAGFVDSLMAWSLEVGKKTGVVTTTRITHATPAGTYAHTGDRDWESSVADKCGQGVKDIAYQLINEYPGKNFSVILGGGRQHFDNRTDNVNLIDVWKTKNPNGAYVSTRKELKALKARKNVPVLGLFSPDHIPFYIDQTERDKEQLPTLEEMTIAAIEILESQSTRGWTLLVEGGRIDQAHHLTRAQAALQEMFQFDKAIQAAKDRLNPKETLIVVTADHSHTFTLGGYPYRGNNILGLTQDLGLDNKTYATLSYANGPYYIDGPRKNLTHEEVLNVSYVSPVAVPIYEETHGGEDVGVFAIGPWSHLFSGVHDQSYIAHVIAHAACLKSPGFITATRRHCWSSTSVTSSLSVQVPLWSMLMGTATSMYNGYHTP